MISTFPAYFLLTKPVTFLLVWPWLIFILGIFILSYFLPSLCQSIIKINFQVQLKYDFKMYKESSIQII